MSDTRPPIDYSLLDRYAAGECSSADAVTVGATLGAHPRVAQGFEVVLEEVRYLSLSKLSVRLYMEWLVWVMAMFV